MMKITFLGTSAATSYPLAFCRCNYCNKARELGGKDTRKRSSIIINDDMLIDFGPDTLAASSMYGKPITSIRYLLQTHSHADHFDASHLSTRAPDFMGINTPPLDVYASAATFKKMTEMLILDGYIRDIFDGNEQKRLNLKPHVMKHGETISAGVYEITAFTSDHDPMDGSMIYAVRENDLTLLYATDTDVFPENTWSTFQRNKNKFDLVIMDHTYGPGVDGGGHLNADQFLEHLGRMKREGLLAENARVFATHISHEGNPTHDELSNYASQRGYEIAYDGMVIG